VASSPIKSDDLLNAWSRGQWQSVYLFAGQEDFLIQQAFEKAAAHWLGDDQSGINLDRYDGETSKVGPILEAFRTVPFLGGARVIRVDNAASFTASEQDQIAEGMALLAESTHVIFIWGKEWRRDDAKKGLVEATTERGQVVIFWPLFPEAAVRWVVQRAKHYKKTLATDVAAWLVQQQGEGLRMLDQELAKVSAYVGERPAIELEDLQASFGYEKASSPFEWTAAIRQKEAATALGLLKHLLAEGEQPIRLLALLSRGLRDWLSAKNSGEGAAMLAMRFHLRRGEENRFLKDLGRWSEKDLMDGIGQCLEIEQAVKTGKEEPDMGITLLSLRLCGQGLYAAR
jgi:DNA polymerase III subunit delta